VESEWPKVVFHPYCDELRGKSRIRDISASISSSCCLGDDRSSDCGFVRPNLMAVILLLRGSEKLNPS